MLLRHAGFVVDEAFNVKAALAVIKADSVAAVLLCHTIPESEQHWLISAAHKVRKSLPIVCINDREYFMSHENCCGTTNEPAHLIEIVKKVTQS
jgi:DNA-binding response OmpR family regulator